MPVRVFDRGALVGTAISAIAGVSWSLWAASALSHLSAVATLIVAGVGVLVGVLIFVSIVRARGTATRAPRSSSMFSSRRYLLVVLGEIAAIFVGALVLPLSGGTAYFPAWVACVVGVHFLVFGRFFRKSFYVLGGTLIGAAVIGTIVGLAGGGPDGITATTGILAAACLFTAGVRVFISQTERTIENAQLPVNPGR